MGISGDVLAVALCCLSWRTSTWVDSLVAKVRESMVDSVEDLSRVVGKYASAGFADAEMW